MDYAKTLAEEFKLKTEHCKNIIDLIDGGNTIPFIARYRKEMTGSADDQVLRELNDRLEYLRNLDKRKGEVADAITAQGKITLEILAALDKALTLAVVEDIYRPFKQKKKTRAGVAIEKGLEPLADEIQKEEMTKEALLQFAQSFVSEEKGVESAEQAVTLALDIVAERVSDSAEVRRAVREYLTENASLKTVFHEKEYDRVSKLKEEVKKGEKTKFLTYEMYKEYSEKISSIPSHRILAINRGESEDCLKVTLEYNKEVVTDKINAMFIHRRQDMAEYIEKAVADSYDRLIFPSIERELRNMLTERADEQAIKMFEVNLRPLLMQPPLKGKVIMALDPAYRTGCKIAVIDACGNVLATDVVYPTPPQSKIAEAELKLTALINKFSVDVISIGNGTASKEAEIFVAGMIPKCGRKVSYAVVNEAGASVYSASKLGAEEFPEYDVSLRSAVSIARRLQDPLAELIKIDVKSIGVGQYQHDMPQARLTAVLDGVVEDCVNSVGVDLNNASVRLLTFVAGLNEGTAKSIVEYRKEKSFRSREELLKVKKLGAKAYEQCAGFLRIHDGDNILDNTSVHPESYESARKLIELLGHSMDEVKNGLKDIKKELEERGVSSVAKTLGIGEPTLIDIATELGKPGRDVRDSLPPPVLRSDLMDINSLKPGMEITGTVRNVIDFGVFVDIGVHQDGLVHISELSDNFVKHPSEVVKVGDVVKVRVLGVDPERKKISLTMKSGEKPAKKPNNEKREKRREPVREQSLEEKLAALQRKFGK